jgi:hypothetical protein
MADEGLIPSTLQFGRRELRPMTGDPSTPLVGQMRWIDRRAAIHGGSSSAAVATQRSRSLLGCGIAPSGKRFIELI